MEDIIASASAFKDALESMITEYRGMVPVVEREKLALEKRSLTDFENNLHAKRSAVVALEEAAAALIKHGGALQSRIDPASGDRIKTTSELVADLLTFARGQKDAGLSGQVLNHVVAQLVKLTEQLEPLRTEVVPRIQLNQVLLEELLNSYRQSQRFWQEVVSEIEATYKPDGKVHAESASTLRVQV